MATRKKRRKADGGLVAKALQYLATQQDIHAERRNSGAVKIGDRIIKLGAKGTLDVSGYLMRPGYLATPFEIEMKTSAGKLRPSQEKRIELLEKLNVPNCVARSLADIVKFVQSLRGLPVDHYKQARRLGA